VQGGLGVQAETLDQLAGNLEGLVVPALAGDGGIAESEVGPGTREWRRLAGERRGRRERAAERSRSALRAGAGNRAAAAGTGAEPPGWSSGSVRLRRAGSGHDGLRPLGHDAHRFVAVHAQAAVRDFDRRVQEEEPAAVLAAGRGEGKRLGDDADDLLESADAFGAVDVDTDETGDGGRRDGDTFVAGGLGLLMLGMMITWHFLTTQQANQQWLAAKSQVIMDGEHLASGRACTCRRGYVYPISEMGCATEPTRLTPTRTLHKCRVSTPYSSPRPPFDHFFGF